MRMVVVDGENAHGVVKGCASRTTQAHRNDRGFLGCDGEIVGEVDARDDIGCGARAVIGHDLDAVDGGVLCDADDIASDCASDVSAIYDV